MRKVLAALFTVAMLIGMSSMLTACNTTAGAGQDISATGHAITKGAEKLKP
ncbi:MAG TPA: entericidin A/B family lipoprotein [Acetobacteraceae bacterium]|nr:entericidin A/B family lipoprotein [Acetobacteraceae bacterium]